MRILIYGINFTPEITGIGKYTGEMAKAFVLNNNEIRIVTAPPYYPDWRIGKGYSAWKYRVENLSAEFSIYRCPLYVPSIPKTMSRLLHLTSFAISSIPVMARLLFWKPEAIIMVAPTLFCAPVALLISRLSGARVVLHIQDYEVDAMFALGMMENSSVARIVFAFERWLMKHFDRVSSISHRMMNKAVEKGVSRNKIIFFPNWVDTQFVNPDISGQAYRIEWGFCVTDKVILYSGNIGEKQGLEVLLEAAVHFHDREEIRFVIVGQGAGRRELEELAGALQLSNVFFHDLQPYERLPELLSMADIHLVVQKRGATDVVFPSKLTSIFSVGGHALITAELDTELGILCEDYPGIAHRIEPEDLSALIDGIEFMLEQNTSNPNLVARKYAEEYLDKKKVLPRFMDDLKKLIAEG